MARVTAESLGVKVQVDPEPQRNSFIRSDQYNFIRHGIPAVAMAVGYIKDSSEQSLFKEWRTKRYHAPSDDLNQPVELSAAARYEEIVRALMVGLANNSQPPRWKKESFFARYAQPGGGN
jgi:Zn-dependent M28 family amino/carboxypeptidase